MQSSMIQIEQSNRVTSANFRSQVEKFDAPALLGVGYLLDRAFESLTNNHLRRSPNELRQQATSGGPSPIEPIASGISF
jgi:hypothetical protein